jgi:6-phosphogluconolactonase (cycloisomerase 2 family)
MFLYIGSRENKLGVFQVDDETGVLIRTVDVIDPVIENSLLPPQPERGFWSLASPSSYTPSTGWILRHPHLDLIYAFTGFRSQREALVTTYLVDRPTGKLTKLGVCSTGGLHVSYATFSPDGSVLAVCHLNDGRLCFFDCTAESNSGVLETPIRVVETPELRSDTRTTDFPNCLPSLHHCLYTPDGKFLLTVDSSSQSRIWTYPVDSRGLVVSNHASSNIKIRAIQPPPGAMISLAMSQIFQSQCKLRRVAIHPDGAYAYILLETHSVIQVYEITKTGTILADCLQEIPCIDPSFFDRSLPPWKQTFVGVAANMAAELLATRHGLWVSNRGLKLIAGRVDNSVRFYEYQDDGARLAYQTHVDPQGPVRHFAHLESGGGGGGESSTMILTGMNHKDPGVVETFVKSTSVSEGGFKKVGEAATGLDVLCIVPVPEQAKHV